MAWRAPRSTQNMELKVPRELVEQGDPTDVLERPTILLASPDMAGSARDCWIFALLATTRTRRSSFPPFLTAETKTVEFRKRLEQLLTHRWIPALNAICGHFAGLEDDEVELLTDQAVDYIISGPGQ